MSMSRIIYCSDLVLRIGDEIEEITNITQWIMESTEFRPQYPEQCVLREEVGAAGKLYLIFVVWIALVVVTTFYCYFCEQRLFSKRRNMGEWAAMRKSGWLMCSNRRVGADSAYSGPPSPPPPPPPPQSPSSFNTTDTFVASPAPYNNSGARLLYPDATASSNLKFREFRRLDDPVPNFPAGGQVPAYQIQNQLQNHQFPYQRNHFPWARSDSTERLTEVTSD